MRRRTLVTALLAGWSSLAGCLRRDAPPSDRDGSTVPESATATETETPTSSTTRTWSPRTTTVTRYETGPIAAIRIHPAPRWVPFRHAVALSSQPSREHPAKLRIRMWNVSRTVHTVQGREYGLPFPTPIPAETPAGSQLYLAENADPERKEGAWVGTPTHLPQPQKHRFDPGESLDRTYAVVNDPDNASAWTSGTYRFMQTLFVDPRMETTVEGNDWDEDERYRWGFDLVVR